MYKGEVTTYKDLIYWKSSKELAILVYKITENFPKMEVFGLASQMRRCAISIPSNIAEGYRRMSRPEYKKFLTYSFGSGAELETQLEISEELGYITDRENFNFVYDKLQQIMKMLNVAIKKLN